MVFKSTEKVANQHGTAPPSIAICSWIVCSVGTSIFNKLAISIFPYPCSLLLLQMAFTVLAIMLFGCRSLYFGSFKDVLRWGMTTPFFAGMVLTSMIAVKGAPLSLVITFRAFIPIVSMVSEYLFSFSPLDVRLATVWPLVFIVAGTLLYAKDIEPETRVVGCGWVLLNTAFSVVDRLLQRRLLAKDECPVDISITGVTLLNNLFGVVPLLFAAVYMEEDRHILAAWERLDIYTLLPLLVSCTLAAGISFTGTVVQSLISATSFLILVNANKFLVLFAEVTLLHVDKALTMSQGFGAILSVIGSLLWGCGLPDWDRFSLAARKFARRDSCGPDYGTTGEADVGQDQKSPA